jgi:hypothetical protein
MYELRLVKDGAPAIGMMADGSKKIYLQSDTIPISSEWTVEQAAVLLKLTKDDLSIIVNSHMEADAQWLLGFQPKIWKSHEYKTFKVYFSELISLSIAHEKSKLSLEQFIKKMEEYTKMNKRKSAEIGNYLVEQFYWAGEYVTYINHIKYNGTYDDAIGAVIKADDTFVFPIPTHLSLMPKGVHGKV